MQGNGAAPAGWVFILITILKAHKSQGHGASFLCPNSKLHKDISCILYVDDNDIIYLSEDKSGTTHEALLALQDSIMSWSNLLVTTGGALKPPK